MVGITLAAYKQVQRLYRFYSNKGRSTAFANLRSTIDAAAAAIQANPNNFFQYPARYRQVAKHNFRWIKVHSYWISFAVVRAEPIITNVFYETANIPRRVETDETPFGEA